MMVLRTKIIALLTLVLLLAVGVSTIVTLNVQSKRMVEGKINDIKGLTNIILRSTETAMSKGRTQDVQEMVESIGSDPEVISLRILSNDGSILKSMNPEEIGTKSRGFAKLKYVGEKKLAPIVDGDVINMFVPIANKKQCYGCHSPAAKINGIIDLSYDISRSRADILAVKRFLVLSNILTVLIAAAIIGFLITRLVTKPLGRFMQTIKAVEDGDWDARVAVSGTDELGAIETAFNKMIDEVQSLYAKNVKKEKEISRVRIELDHKRMLEDLNAQLQHKVKEVESANKAVMSLSKEVKAKNKQLQSMVGRLEKINEVGRVLTSIIETEELIKLIIRTNAELLMAETGSIHLKKSENEKVTMTYQKGVGVESTDMAAEDLNPLYKNVLLEGAPVFVSKASTGQEGGATPAVGVPLKMKGQIIGGMLFENKTDGGEFTSDDMEFLSTLANQAMVAIENAWLYETVKSNYFGTIQSLVNALEASDRYTKGHSERVRALSMELAKYVGLDYKELEVLEHAAILHDIGKIGIDSFVLNKAGKLSSTEFSLIRAHPIIGDEILGPIGTLEGVRTTILQHHERYDGAGYPYGITGDEISLKARILAVVDVFDAMVTDRPYRKALTLSHALDELKDGSSSQFDPFIVSAFMEMLYTKENLLETSGYTIS